MYTITIIKTGDIFCDTDDACRSQSYTCDEPRGCLISCDGQEACQDSQFTCPFGCDVQCYNTASCVDSTFLFLTDDSSLHCKGSNSCTDATIRVFNDTTLELTCMYYVLLIYILSMFIIL